MIETISNTNNTIENQIVHCIRRATAVFYAVHMQCTCNVCLHIPKYKNEDYMDRQDWKHLIMISIPIATLNAVPGNEWFSVSSWDSLGMKFTKHVAKVSENPHQGRPALARAFSTSLGTHGWYSDIVLGVPCDAHANPGLVSTDQAKHPSSTFVKEKRTMRFPSLASSEVFNCWGPMLGRHHHP